MPDEVGELAEDDRAEPFEADGSGPGGQGGLVDVGIQGGGGSKLCRIQAAKRVEEVCGEGHGPVGRVVILRLPGVLEQQGEELGGSGQPSERLGAELVAGPRRMLGAGAEDVGDPGDGGVDPEGVAGGDRAMTVRRPVGSRRDRATKRLAASAARRASWPAGSASMILASAISNTRDGAWPAIASATAASTTPTASSGRRRVITATFLATHASAVRSSTLAQIAGEPVLQVEDVGRDCSGGQGVHAAGDAQLDEGEILNAGGAGAAEDIEPVATRHAGAGLVAGIGGVQAGPVGDKEEVFGLDRATPPAAVLELAQRVPGVEGVGDRDHDDFIERMFEQARSG
ncbi:MAG: hypothetical protein ACRDOZ_06900, partial [Nocardioides sp.]